MINLIIGVGIGLLLYYPIIRVFKILYNKLNKNIDKI